MQYGLIAGERTKAYPGGKAVCPTCGEELVAKCGSIKIWHWSHKSDSDCDKWSEGETEWHLGWKNMFPKELQEVVIKKGDVIHRADVCIPTWDGKQFVVELQHSPISPEEIKEREEFYEDMVWIFDAQDFADNFKITDKGEYQSFYWRYPRKSLMTTTKPTLFHLPDTVIHHRHSVDVPPYNYEKWGTWDEYSTYVKENLCDLKILDNGQRIWVVKHTVVSTTYQDNVFYIQKHYDSGKEGNFKTGWGYLDCSGDVVSYLLSKMDKPRFFKSLDRQTNKNPITCV
ncbi:competence protein CoiA [Fischerella sp. PCC 9605]|uniref:competence protein CoiA n=1 Tax=Fischerella sp. PCC 9605 TaxID=1173024 RepID=UPI0004B12E66|nr:competence protein CoiA family protein [Fischerella sp. PCC 9605]